jgi:hypothetical protein
MLFALFNIIECIFFISLSTVWQFWAMQNLTLHRTVQRNKSRRIYNYCFQSDNTLKKVKTLQPALFGAGLKSWRSITITSEQLSLRESEDYNLHKTVQVRNELRSYYVFQNANITRWPVRSSRLNKEDQQTYLLYGSEWANYTILEHKQNCKIPF